VCFSCVLYSELSVDGTDDVWFINFYSPRCSHCHELAPAVSVALWVVTVFTCTLLLLRAYFYGNGSIGTSHMMYWHILWKRWTQSGRSRSGFVWGLYELLIASVTVCSVPKVAPTCKKRSQCTWSCACRI